MLAGMFSKVLGLLNPLDRTDRFDDADQDGMTNWEEYNSISTLSNVKLK